MEREIISILTPDASKVLGKSNTESLVISKRLKFPKDDGTNINFIAPIRMYF